MFSTRMRRTCLTLAVIAAAVAVPTAAQAKGGHAPPSISFSPSSFDFGFAAPGTQSAQQSFTLTNSGGSSTGRLTTALSPPPPGFVTSTNTCWKTRLAPGASCTVSASFTPISIGLWGATLSASDGKVFASTDLHGEAAYGKSQQDCQAFSGTFVANNGGLIWECDNWYSSSLDDQSFRDEVLFLDCVNDGGFGTGSGRVDDTHWNTTCS